MTRGGRDKNRDESERRCIVTGESQPRGGLVRFVVGPDATVVPDVSGKLPGRGMYVSADRTAIEQAVKRRLFSRAAKMQVSAPDELADQVHDLLTRRVIDSLSMARKAGQAVAGYEKVRDWLQKGEGKVLIQAHDGSERGKTKLRAPEGHRSSYIGCLSSAEMGLAFGREHVIHAALAAGGLRTRVVEEAAKLARLRERDGGIPAEED